MKRTEPPVSVATQRKDDHYPSGHSRRRSSSIQGTSSELPTALGAVEIGSRLLRHCSGRRRIRTGETPALRAGAFDQTLPPWFDERLHDRKRTATCRAEASNLAHLGYQPRSYTTRDRSARLSSTLTVVRATTVSSRRRRRRAVNVSGETFTIRLDTRPPVGHSGPGGI